MTMAPSTIPNKVHFVGSVAFGTVEDVFRELGTACGRRLRRVPDGEPGGRRSWVGWMWPVFRANPYFEHLNVGDVEVMQFKLAPGVEPSEITFGELGYAREARTSYQDFVAARERGELPEDVRFQVSLPTPFAASSFVPEAAAETMPAFERAMFDEVNRLAKAIPHDDLAIQWDVCMEMLVWDGGAGWYLPQLPDYQSLITAAMERCCAAVPQDIELGVHLCYGDMDAKHMIQPKDLGKAVELANVIARVSPHKLAWVHMPVPADRHDDAYFAPLADLQLDPDTELYLGLVHADGKQANDRRIAAAAQVVADFGIACECGIARQRTEALVRELLNAHAASSVEP
jgi:methionine synthase II (cobalamin-independent)